MHDMKDALETLHAVIAQLEERGHELAGAFRAAFATIYAPETPGTTARCWAGAP